MNTKNKLLIAIAILTILTTSIASTNAMNGNGTWSGQQMWKWKNPQQQNVWTKSVKWQNQWTWNCDWTWSWKNNENKVNNPADTIKDIAVSDLTDQEKQDLYYQYSEEMVARDAYNYFYELYQVQTFKNIAESEQEHMDAVKVLLDRYNLEAPTNYWELQDEFDALKSEWETWLKEAIEVWLKIEMLDINDIVDTIKSTDNDDIKVVLLNIGWASYNHLRGFSKALENNSLTTSIDISLYLDNSNQTWNLKDKLLSLLESQWVVFSTEVKDAYQKEDCTNNLSSTKNQNKKQVNESKKNAYKKTIDKKYWSKIKKFNSSAKTTIQEKINLKIQEIEESNTLNEDDKEKYLTLYYALQEYIDEN